MNNNDTATTPTADEASGLAALYTPGQLDVLHQLLAHQEALGLTDAAFVRGYLTVSGTAWSRIKGGKYGANADEMFSKLAVNLRQLRIKLAQDAKLTGGKQFYSFAQQQAVIDAVTTCLLKPADDQNRFVAYLAPTGGGKTSLGRQLKVMHDAVHVEATESWRTSYFAALVAIGKAAGCNLSELRKGTMSAEAAVISRFCANRRVLLIDEGEYFGARTINLLKLLLNQTPTVVVVLAIPELFARWNSAAWAEAAQITRRAEAIVRLDHVMPDEVAQLLSTRVAVTDNRVAGMVARAANEFGAYDLVMRVLAQLTADADGEKIGPEETAQAIRCVNRLLNRAAA